MNKELNILKLVNEIILCLSVYLPLSSISLWFGPRSTDIWKTYWDFKELVV